MFSALLLSWYDAHKRVLPFRGTKDPYRIWVSEIMLQQTRTETVGAYYARFLQRFPDVFSLAAAPEEDVLKCWEGLGYYSRARNLHKAAQTVAEQYGGEFPADLKALRALPGVGDYTAAAVASIAFDLPAPAMDGNLTRVLSRFHGVREDVGIPSVQRRLAALAREDMPPVRCGDFNQALMDLGATVCIPGTPDCGRCPRRTLCDACRAGDADALPVKAAAKPPVTVQLAVAIVTCHGRALMVQRKEALLKNLWVFPLIEGAQNKKDVENGLKALGVRGNHTEKLGQARHVFTHRVWEMTLYRCQAADFSCKAGQYVSLAQMNALPLPTAMRAAREKAAELLAPVFVPANDALLPDMARAYSASWRQAHQAHCSEAFLRQHTPQAMEALLRRRLAEGMDVFAVQSAGRTEGVLVLDKKNNELVSLYIHPDAQGIGLGRAAADFAVKTLDPARDMRVTCLQSNEAARKLYISCGFTQISAVRTLDESRDLREEDRVRPAGRKEHL